MLQTPLWINCPIRPLTFRPVEYIIPLNNKQYMSKKNLVQLRVYEESHRKIKTLAAKKGAKLPEVVEEILTWKPSPSTGL